MKLLITGGGGMVGRNLRAHPGLADWGVFSPGSAELDLTDTAATFAYFQRLRPDFVIHCAGKVGGIQANIAAPVDFLTLNTDMGRNVILAARAAGVKSLLNLASSCIYPRFGHNPLSEDMVLGGELEPTNEGYAIAKIFALRLCQYVQREDPSLHYKTFIPCNLYGPFDHFDPKSSHLVPAVIRKVHDAKVQGLDTVEIWGDGTARREFMYAGDLAEAMVKAVGDFPAVPDIMNVGLGFDYSINDYYAAVAQVIGWSGRFVHDTTKPVGMKQKLVDVSRQTTWGFAPATALHDGIAKTYAYFLETAA